MADIFIGLIVIAIGSVFMYGLAEWLWHRTRPLVVDIAAVATVVGTILYGFLLRDHVIMARLLPFSNMIVLSNWFPLSASFLAGIAWYRVPGAEWRKAISTLALLGIALFSAVAPLTGQPPECDNRWFRGVCLQTSPQSCSPASAATLLAQFDIETTEQEMARLCLTRNGSTWQGIYHGLAVKLKNTPWRVEVFDGTLDELRAAVAEAPMILSVELRQEDASVHHEYDGAEGWIEGVPHTVVLMGVDDFDQFQVADPTRGPELWSLKDMEVLWHGRGMRIVPR